MKKLTIILLTFAISSVSFAQISGTAHDFSTQAWNSTGEICIVCHTPHNADASISDAPLWNHQTTSTVFTLYSSGTLNSTPGQPSGSSLLCLSCHDGTVALENFSGTTTGSNMISGSFNLGADLSNDHPISMTYDAALATADGGLFDPTTTNSGLGGTIDSDMLISGELQCASCHDVHGTAYSSLLRIDNAASALCLTCHNK